MRIKISVSELGRELGAILNRVRLDGRSYLIEQDGEVVAILESPGAPRSATWGTVAQTIREVPSADADFAAVLEEIQRNQPEMPAANWPN